MCPWFARRVKHRGQAHRHRNQINGRWSTAGGQLERKEAFDVFRCCRACGPVGLVLCGKPSWDRLVGCHDVPVRQPVLRQSAARAGRRRAGCVLGRVRQRTDALASRLASSCDDAVMPVICPTCQTPRVVTRNVAKTAFFRPPIIRRFRKATAV